MKRLAYLLLLLPAIAAAQSHAPPILLLDSNGNPFPSGSGTPPANTAPPMTCVTNVSGNMQYCNFSGGGGGGGSVTMENIYSSPGSFTFTHNLNSTYPLVQCWAKTTGTVVPCTAATIDANNTAVSVGSAGDYIVNFIATAALSADFSIAASPTSQTFQPTMSGTQQPTFTINQTAIGGYTGTATYTVSGLASGMTGAYSPTTITGTGSNVLTLSFPSTQASATTTFTATGTDGAKVHNTSPAITVGNINSGLIEGWPMTDGSGTTFANPITGNTETLTGTCTWASNAGLPGTTCTMSATGTALSASNALANFTGTTPFSASAWVKAAGSVGANRTIISDIGGANSTGWEMGYSPSGQINVFLINNFGTGNLIQTATTAAITGFNNLHYFVFTYDGSQTAAGVKVYVDGVNTPMTVTTNGLSASIASGLNIGIGGRPAASLPINGLIAYVRIYNRALSATDVSNYFAAGAR